MRAATKTTNTICGSKDDWVGETMEVYFNAVAAYPIKNVEACALEWTSDRDLCPAAASSVPAAASEDGSLKKPHPSRFSPLLVENMCETEKKKICAMWWCVF